MIVKVLFPGDSRPESPLTESEREFRRIMASPRERALVRRGAREVGSVPPCAGAARKTEEPEALGAEGSAQVQPEMGPIVPEGRKMKTCHLSPEANDEDFRAS